MIRTAPSEQCKRWGSCTTAMAPAGHSPGAEYRPAMTRRRRSLAIPHAHGRPGVACPCGPTYRPGSRGQEEAHRDLANGGRLRRRRHRRPTSVLALGNAWDRCFPSGLRDVRHLRSERSQTAKGLSIRRAAGGGRRRPSRPRVACPLVGTIDLQQIRASVAALNAARAEVGGRAAHAWLCRYARNR